MKQYLVLLTAAAAVLIGPAVQAQPAKPLIPFPVTEDFCLAAYAAVQSSKAKIAATPQAVATGNFSSINFAKRRDATPTNLKGASIADVDAYNSRLETVESQFSDIIRDGLKKDPAKITAVLAYVRQCDALKAYDPILGAVPPTP
ncbi:hypothetical protein BH11PSE2_BH11PSE2_16290 [soil metagenome]